MVQLYKFLLSSVKKSLPRNTFLDSLRLHVKGGHGGNGIPKYGGIGGQGGCVYVVAKENLTLNRVTQRHQKKQIYAKAGTDSAKYCIIGRRGTDEQIEVPVGVIVLDENKNKLADLNVADAKCIVAGGGMGGCTGTNFIGNPGESRTITLDLKLIADIGLVGFPNAGKSTLLKGLSRASPKIASYPFTTIRPQIGILEYPDYRTISVADLPGLIEGAHANKGMGHKFLKHVERTRLLLMIVDIFGFQLNVLEIKRNCLENIYSLNKELELYDPTLLEKPCILLINKMDLNGSQEELERIKNILNDLRLGLNECPDEIKPKKLIKFEKVIPISAKDLIYKDEVKNNLRSVLDDIAAHKIEEENYEKVQRNLQNRLRERGPRIT